MIDPGSGEIREAQVFVGTLGASNLTYGEASWTQGLADWLGAHRRMFEFFGGAPEVLVPDNLRAGVKRAHCYDPEINPSYQKLADHYGLAVVPARVRHPRDKAKVEVGVQGVERWVLAPLRHLSQKPRTAVLQLLVTQPVRQGPGQAGRNGPPQIIRHRRMRQAAGRGDLTSAQPLLVQAQHFSHSFH